MVGVQKLNETEAIVDSLKADLTKLEPILVQKSIDADKLLANVAIEKADADVVKEKVRCCAWLQRTHTQSPSLLPPL